MDNTEYIVKKLLTDFGMSYTFIDFSIVRDIRICIVDGYSDLYVIPQREKEIHITYYRKNTNYVKKYSSVVDSILEIECINNKDNYTNYLIVCEKNKSFVRRIFKKPEIFTEKTEYLISGSKVEKKEYFVKYGEYCKLINLLKQSNERRKTNCGASSF